MEHWFEFTLRKESVQVNIGNSFTSSNIDALIGGMEGDKRDLSSKIGGAVVIISE